MKNWNLKPVALENYIPRTAVLADVCEGAAALLVYPLFAFLISIATAHAASPVGMEAQGVDAWTAWHQSGSLDVRDELNRPVSARRIESQVKNAMVETERRLAFSSRLPRAKTVLLWLERLQNEASSIRSQCLWLPRVIEEALPWILRPPHELLLCLTIARLLTLAACMIVLTSSLLLNRRDSCLFVPLRC